MEEALKEAQEKSATAQSLHQSLQVQFFNHLLYIDHYAACSCAMAWEASMSGCRDSRLGFEHMISALSLHHGMQCLQCTHNTHTHMHARTVQCSAVLYSHNELMLQLTVSALRVTVACVSDHRFSLQSQMTLQRSACSDMLLNQLCTLSVIVCVTHW